MKKIVEEKIEEDWGEMWIQTDVIDEIDIEDLVKDGYSKEAIRKSLEFLGYHRVPSNKDF